MFGQKKHVVLLSAFFVTGSVFANPVLSNHVAPTGATIDQTNPLKTVINQSDSHAIINWHSFNIGNNEETHFEQPRGGVAVNRINPKHGVSEIYGHLSATGQVVLINQAGIHFGPGSKVDVGSIIAKSHHSIINDGTINANNYGLVALLSPTVANHGVINAKLGTIVLASGNKFTLDFYGDELINFAIDKEFTEGKGVENTGALYADGGRILVTAKAAQNIVDNVINMQGMAQANRVEEHNGEIVIYGGEHGITEVDADIHASSGKVHMDGEIIKVNRAKINVSGDPAGKILIGGNNLGKHIKLFGKKLPNAQKTSIYPGTELLANAITNGDGGNIVIWSNDLTRIMSDKNNRPLFSARGGALSGNGGTIETSGKHLYIDDVASQSEVNLLKVKTDLSAPHGEGGIWVLDPYNATISNAPTANFSPGGPGQFFPTANNANFNAASIESILNGGTSVQILASNPPGDLTVSDPISWTTNRHLTLTGNFIYINAKITATLGTLSLGAKSSTTPNIFAPAFNNDFNSAIQVAHLIITAGGVLASPVYLNAIAITAIYSGQPNTQTVYSPLKGQTYFITKNLNDIQKKQIALDKVLNDRKINTNCK